MNAGKHDWANLNTLRAYPLEYDIQPSATSGFALPYSLLSDCFVVIQADNVIPSLSAIHFSASILTLAFVDANTGKEIFFAQSPLNADYTTANIMDVSDYGITGSVTFGEIKNLSNMTASGIHKFVFGKPKLSAHCYMCSGAPSIKSFSANLGKLYGEVELRLGGSLAAVVETSDPEDTDGIPEHTITFILADPLPFLDVCAPVESVCDCPFRPIRNINTVYPYPKDDPKEGQITLEVDPSISVLSVNVVGDTINISVKGSSETSCPKENIPFADGRLPSEAGETA